METVEKGNIKKIKIDTKPFGQMEILENSIIHFPEGIFAFEHLKKYTLISTKKKLSFKWLQSLEDKNIAFLITDPTEFIRNYSPAIHEESLSIIEVKKCIEVNLYCIITVPSHKPEAMTINLQGPILINPRKMLAAQFISEDESHGIRESLFRLLENNKSS